MRVAVQGDAARSLGELDALLGEPRARAGLRETRQARCAPRGKRRWTQPRRTSARKLPTDAQVLGAVNRTIGAKGTVVCAAGGLPGELHKLWRAQDRDAYHVEYGYSCMGYEIAGGLGVKMARPDRDVAVLVGDGSYLMMNSEIATSVAMGLKLTIVLLDNRGFGCINRLQGSCGGESFNNLLDERAPDIDFAAHARSLGAHAQKVTGIRALEAALRASRSIDRTTVIVIDTDPQQSTAAGGAWWDVAVPEVSAQRGRACGARRLSREARRTRRRIHERPHRHQSAHLEQRRPAGARRREQPRDLPHRGARGGLRRRRARQQVSAAAATLRPILQSHGLALVSGWYSGRLLERDADAELTAMRAHLELLHTLGCEVMVFAEVTPLHARRPARAVSQRPHLADRRLASASARASRSSPSACSAKACASPITITWARSCNRRRTSIG